MEVAIMALSCRVLMLIHILIGCSIIATTLSSAVHDVKFDHIVELDENFRLLWLVQDPDIIFEVQARTLGYIGFGFSRSDFIYGSDIVVGWVDKHTFFQDRHIPVHSNTGEPVIDNSQDYILMSAYENATHTVMRFRRKLITCDEKYDVPITNDTMKIVYMYHDDEPKKSSFVHHGALPHPEQAVKPIKSLLLLQRPKFERLDESLETFDVGVKNVVVTSNTTKACRTLRIKRHRKSQIVAFRPHFEPHNAHDYVIHMMVYECKHRHVVDDDPSSSLSSFDEDSCENSQKLNCPNIVATWSKGSQGFVYPDDVGYPLEDSSYFIEVHYEPLKLKSSFVVDSTAMRFSITRQLRKHEAGLLSIGIQPAWTHIIPPGFRKVTSIGYCSGKCNKDALPDTGINVIGLQMQTHEMGKSIKVGLVRSDGIEQHPIGQDYSLNSEYLEYRSLDNHVRILPNDDLIVECSYNSYEKTKLTLGGYDAQQEVCQATLIYYPRQHRLTSCQSKPKTKNFLKSLNVEKLRNSQPYTIELPEKYAGKTLEEHLKSYNWKTEFDHFERVSKTSPIDIVCLGEDKKIVTDDPVSIKHPFKPFSSHCELHRHHQREFIASTEYVYDVGNSDAGGFGENGGSNSDMNSIHNIQLARSKVLRSSELNDKLNFANNSTRLNIHKWILLVHFMLVVSFGISCGKL